MAQYPLKQWAEDRLAAKSLPYDDEAARDQHEGKDDPAKYLAHLR